MFLQHLLNGFGIALVLNRADEIPSGKAGVRMLFPQKPAPQGENLFLERAGPAEVSLPPEGEGPS